MKQQCFLPMFVFLLIAGVYGIIEPQTEFVFQGVSYTQEGGSVLAWVSAILGALYVGGRITAACMDWKKQKGEIKRNDIRQ